MLSQTQVVKVKAALERGYIGLMDVYEYRQATNPTTHVTSATETKVLEQIPCRLSFSQSPSTGDGDVASVSQTIKVFFDSVYNIKAGSKVVVTQNGTTTAYKHAGLEAIYDTHSEVVLELFERWA